jgi:hypothetical protein
MATRIRRSLVAGMLIGTAGCCLRFSDLPAGASYAVGDTITTSRTQIAVEKFEYGNGQWTENGRAQVDTRGYAKGSGQDLNARNVNLRFAFRHPLKSITLKSASWEATTTSASTTSSGMSATLLS